MTLLEKIIVCRVCSKNYDGTRHYGVDICRACGLFFRRAKSWKSVPACFTGDNNCNLRDQIEKPCPSCRLRKCSEIGLRPNLCLTDDPSTSEEVTMQNDLSFLKIEEMPTLSRISYYYTACTTKRRQFEYGLLYENQVELLQMPEGMPMGKLSQSRLDQIYSYNLPMLKNTIAQRFPAFCGMEKEQQTSVVHQLMFSLFDLESSYRTLRTMKDPKSSKLICTETMYVDLEEFDDFVDSMEDSDDMDFQQSRDYLQMCWRRYLETTHSFMHTMKITDMEFMAAFGLVIWNNMIYPANSELSSFAERQHSFIYKDLHYYYRNILKMDDYVERVMNLQELIKIIIKNSLEVREHMGFLNTFNCFKRNCIIYEASQLLPVVENITI